MSSLNEGLFHIIALANIDDLGDSGLLSSCSSSKDAGFSGNNGSSSGSLDARISVRDWGDVLDNPSGIDKIEALDACIHFMS